MSIVASFIVPHPPLAVPNVGRGDEEQISLTINSYNEVSKKIAELKPNTIIISSPHAPYYRDSFFLSNVSHMVGDFGRFGAKEVSFDEEIDLELVNSINEFANAANIPIAYDDNSILDHGVMVPLYFIRKEYNDFKLVVLGISDLSLTDNYNMGKVIKEACNTSKRIVYVASGDLSHKLQEYGPYGFVPEGPIYDDRVMNDCKNASFDNLLKYDEAFLDKVAQCGHRSFCMMAGALDGVSVTPRFYSHEDITGVGYGILSYCPEDPYVSLARNTINNYISKGFIIDTSSVTDKDMLEKQAGVFVSIHKNGNLRGCIGTFLPCCENIASEIIMNAISASTRDYRFMPITEDELNDLEINVDVLTTPEDISSKDMLDPKKYGVIVTSGSKRGLLLPDLDGVDTVDEQIKISKIKAGISDSEEITLKRFEVVRHK